MVLTAQPQITDFADFEISIANQQLPTAEKLQVVKITVEQDVNLPSMFTLELTNLNDNNGEIQGIDDRLFAVGKAVEVQLGYSGRLETLIQGEITGLEPEFTIDRLPSLVVRGYDRRHRLQRGRKTRTFVQRKDSAIASQIANEAGLTSQVQDSQVEHEYVIQGNQTDWEFLRERACRIQYEVIVENQTLIFRPVANADNESLTLTFDNDLLEFYPCLSSMGQVSEVAVQGWNSQQKQAIAVTARTGAEVSQMGGENTGADVSDSVFNSPVGVISDHPIANEAEARQMATAYFNQNILKYITGEGICRGRTDLTAGKVIRIDGIGQQFSGRYYVICASHRYTQDGYYTHFTLRRNAI